MGEQGVAALAIQIGIGAAVVVAFLVLALGSFFTTKQQTRKVVQRLGKFVRIATPGLSLKWPVIESTAGTISLRIKQLEVKVETKTADNVFVHVAVAVQYRVDENKVQDAFYRLNDPEGQISSYVFDLVRARVPGLKLDDTFAKKDEIANAVSTELKNTMDDFGFVIEKALVTDIEPDAKVKTAMNEINAAQRMREAASEKGEAEKILKIKAAEAEAESNRLHGEGIAKQRKAIVEGLKESVESFQKAVGGSTPQEVMSLVLMTQYFDMMKEVGANSKSTTILLPHSPGHVGNIAEQIRESILVGSAAGSKD